MRWAMRIGQRLSPASRWSWTVAPPKSPDPTPGPGWRTSALTQRRGRSAGPTPWQAAASRLGATKRRPFALAAAAPATASSPHAWRLIPDLSRHPPQTMRAPNRPWTVDRSPPARNLAWKRKAPPWPEANSAHQQSAPARPIQRARRRQMTSGLLRLRIVAASGAGSLGKRSTKRCLRRRRQRSGSAPSLVSIWTPQPASSRR